MQCSYCMPDIPCYLPSTQILSDQEIIKIAEVFVNDLGVRKIRLTGGEPLVRKNAGQIIELLSKLPVELSITTNGVLLDRFFSTFKIVGLKSLNISLDSLMPENFKEITKRDHFYQVFENINQALERGFDVKINSVIKRGMNDHEILDFVEWTRNSPVHVRFIEFMPFDGNRWLSDSVVSFKEILNKIEGAFPIEKQLDKPHSTAKSYQIPGFLGSFGIISTVTEPFCNDCNRIRLSADGKLRNCLFSTAEIDVLSAFREGQDIRPIIQNCILHKQAKRGGLEAFDLRDAEEEYAGGRCMTTIGG